jgi:glycyl-tRNA synthetase beta chain
MATLLFEIGTEELPSWYVPQASAALADLLRERFAMVGVGHGALRSFATPRRLAVMVDDVAAASERRTLRRRGPAERAAYRDDGSPTPALLGFARSTGVEPSALVVEEGEKGRYVYAEIETGGEPSAALLPETLAALVRDLPAPRKMRWSDVDVPFVRPIAWLTALLDDAVVPVEVAGVRAGRSTRGHRFLDGRSLPLAHALDYLATLDEAFVLADRAQRREAVLSAARDVAAREGLELVADAALLDEVCDLVELPVAILGAFAERFLDLPDEVLETVMVHHQRFFPTRGSDGRIAPRFVAVSNNRVPDEGVVRSGYEAVLRGRLEDARFFWDADRTESLSRHAWSLSGIAFQKELGSMGDKVARIGAAARALAEVIGTTPEEAATLRAALPIFRADLATQMVYELPELEGTMGRAYALAEGQPPEVAVALEDGVLPRTPGDRLPTTRVGAMLGIADRLDTLVGFFAIGRRPSGSADPYGLRRVALGVVRILAAQGWRVPFTKLVDAVASAYHGRVDVDAEAKEATFAFVWDRVAGLLAEEGLPPRVVRAATEGSRSAIGAARRAHLLHALMRERGFEDLMTLYKRAANLGRGAAVGATVRPSLFRDEAELPLYEALPDARRGVELLMASVRKQLLPWDLGSGPRRSLEGLEEPVAELVRLKAPLDAFLDGVHVMVEQEDVRTNRLALLAEVAGVLRDLGALEHLEAASEG